MALKYSRNDVKNNFKFGLIGYRLVLISFFYLILSNVYCYSEESEEISYESNTTYESKDEGNETEKINTALCPDDKHNRTCCYENEFQCSDGHCIPHQKLCDKKLDCADSSDEYGCLGLPCSSRVRIKCEQQCKDLPLNQSRCVCFKGYVLKTTSLHKCQDVDECLIGVHWCTHDCINLNGTFGCTCREGFEKDSTGLNGGCKALDQNIMVLYSSDSWIYAYSVDKHKVTPVVHSGKVDEMDYDPINDIIYWSTRHRVARSYLPGALDGKVTIGHPQSVGPSSIWHIKNSLAIDWTAGNLYWISVDILNVNKYQILVSKLDGRYVKTLVDDVMYASSLVVDPEHGKMYWTSGGDKAEIGVAWMNGMFRKQLLKLGDTNPTALTLDNLSNGRLYWSDTKTHSIYSLNTDGTRLIKIITNSASQSAIMMDVFESNLYWITKESNQLVRRDKFGRGETLVLVENLINQTSLKVYHKRRVEVEIRKASLYCKNQCSHLCLHVPRGYACSCPDGSKLLLLMGEILCDAEKEDPLENPLICDCTDKAALCDTSLPYHKCNCPNVKCDDGSKLDQDDWAVSEQPASLYDTETISDHPVEFGPDDYHELVKKQKWNRSLILVLCISPVFICFGLSFCKRPQGGTNEGTGSTTVESSIGFRSEDGSVLEGFHQGGPTIVKNMGKTSTIDNPSNPVAHSDDNSEFQSSAQLLVP